jgi:hypothetical protein
MALTDITNDMVYHTMERDIERCYELGSPFVLNIECKDVKDIHMKYLYRFAKFLARLKKKTPQLLQHSKIHIYDSFIYNLLYTLFTFLCKPIAPVEVFVWTSRDLNTRTIKKIHKFYP